MRVLLVLALLSFAGITVAGDFGEKMPDPLLPLALADVLGDPDIDGSPQVFTGRIKRVCQKAGCWMILADGEHWARVQTHHRFELPKDATGYAAVYGSIDEAEVSAGEAAHMAAESGGEAAHTAHESGAAAHSAQESGGAAHVAHASSGDGAASGGTITEYRIDALGVRIQQEAFE